MICLLLWVQAILFLKLQITTKEGFKLIIATWIHRKFITGKSLLISNLFITTKVWLLLVRIRTSSTTVTNLKLTRTHLAELTIRHSPNGETCLKKIIRITSFISSSFLSRLSRSGESMHLNFNSKFKIKESCLRPRENKLF